MPHFTLKQRRFNGVVGGPPSPPFVPALSGAHSLTLSPIHNKMYTNMLRTAHRSAWRVLTSTAQWQVPFFCSFCLIHYNKVFATVDMLDQFIFFVISHSFLRVVTLLKLHGGSCWLQTRALISPHLQRWPQIIQTILSCNKSSFIVVPFVYLLHGGRVDAKMFFYTQHSVLSAGLKGWLLLKGVCLIILRSLCVKASLNECAQGRRWKEWRAKQKNGVTECS